MREGNRAAFEQCVFRSSRGVPIISAIRLSIVVLATVAKERGSDNVPIMQASVAIRT